MKSSENTVQLTKKYDFFYGAVGVHPSDCEDMTEADIETLRKMAMDNEKIVAIGEIGLDYYYDDPERALQKKWFIRQIELAKELKLPIVIHSRDAAQDTMEILQKTHAGDAGGVMHCYSYSKELSERVLDMGFYIGVGGVVTFKNGRKLVETVENTPLDRIVLETDSPYLSPVPHRGKRNSSLNLILVIRRIAEIKGITPEEVAETTFNNAMKMYRINK
jgi:TatD DNase family protein